MPPKRNPTRVFISYSHDSPEHEQTVLALAGRLRRGGVNAIIDKYEPFPSQGWLRWMRKEIRRARFVLVVCTKTFRRKTEGLAPKRGMGRGATYEGSIIDQSLYDGGGRNHKFVPVFLEEIDIRSLPSFLRGYQYFSVQDEYEDLHRLLTHRSPRNAKPQLGVVSAPPAKITTRSVQASVARAPRVSIARLPSTSPVLVGRQTELSQLDKLWHSRELGLVTILAPGGAGKSALVNAWLSTLRRKKWAGALRVFGWSFYRQGRQGTSQESADLFLANALSWFGDPHPETGETWDKGERLAELVRARRTLLILDGLEPLQSAPSGKLNDPGVEALLRQLATTNCGLCVVSSRLEIDALKDFDTAIMRLDRLSEEAGCELLSKLGVKGIVDELRDAVNEFRGHALALSLLGSYLEAAYGGDVRRRREISSLASEPDMGSHAQRVIESYEVWFQGRPELEVLRLMGLFDRPVEPGALAALLDGPPIQELTDQLQRLSHDGWGFVLKNLRRARLLDPGSNNRLDSLDCHPLIREHFAKKLRETAGSSWRKANKRLFDYYRSTTQEHPDTTGDMSRLYAAVVHGCQAGLFNEAFESVYWSRIQRGRQFASSRKLGMFGADLSALAAFFHTPWTEPVARLDPLIKARVLAQAGFDLRALGRLKEASLILEKAFSAFTRLKQWGPAASVASNLSVLNLHCCRLADAVAIAREGVKLADRSKEPFRRWWERTTLADALHQVGKIREAGRVFAQAERIAEHIADADELEWRFHHGFRYNDFLLTQGAAGAVRKLGLNAIKTAQQSGNVLRAGAGHLYIARADMYESTVGAQTVMHMNEGVQLICRAGQQHFIPKALLTRAQLFRSLGDYQAAANDLARGIAIAERGGMLLYTCDYELEHTRLFLAQGDLAGANPHFQVARDLVARTGYHRRDAEVSELDGLIARRPLSNTGERKKGARRTAR